MSIGPMGMIGAAAGSPLSQRNGSDLERAAQDENSHARETSSSKQALKAEGVGQTEQDHEASDRDADGHRVWESVDDERQEEASPEEQDTNTPSSRDATGERGNHLDLRG